MLNMRYLIVEVWAGEKRTDITGLEIVGEFMDKTAREEGVSKKAAVVVQETKSRTKRNRDVGGKLR